MGTVHPLIAICVGAVVIAVGSFFLRSSAATRTAWTGKPEARATRASGVGTTGPWRSPTERFHPVRALDLAGVVSLSGA